jgi:hypothetical protein
MTGWLEGTVYRGPDGHRQFLADTDAAWAEFHVEIQEYRDLGETVLVLGQTWALGRDGIRVDGPGGWSAACERGSSTAFAPSTAGQRPSKPWGCRGRGLTAPADRFSRRPVGAPTKGQWQ